MRHPCLTPLNVSRKSPELALGDLGSGPHCFPGFLMDLSGALPRLASCQFVQLVWGHGELDYGSVMSMPVTFHTDHVHYDPLKVNVK